MHTEYALFSPCIVNCFSQSDEVGMYTNIIDHVKQCSHGQGQSDKQMYQVAISPVKVKGQSDRANVGLLLLYLQNYWP